jgi:hypothetical protein
MHFLMDPHQIDPICWQTMAQSLGEAHEANCRRETPMRLILAAMIAATAVPAIGAPIGPPAPIVSRTTPAQQMIALYRDEYRHGYVACPTPSHANEVVICGNGRGGSANRIPLPDERAAPEWPRRSTGEIPSAASALNEASSACGPACSQGGAVNLIQAAASLVQIGRALVDPESASDYADRHPR